MQLSEETKQSLILTLLGVSTESKNDSFYKVGQDYVIRTVTMIYLGRLKSEESDSLVFEDCAWIPDTSRWSEFLEGKKPNEMEPYSEDVKVYKGGILDATAMKKVIKRELI